MSGENIIKFYEEAKKNESLKKEFEKLKNQVESGKETKEESLAKKIVSLAKKNGFDFSEKELLNYMEEVKNTLSEEDLLEVSGGRMSAKAAGIGLMGTLMLSFATGATMNLVNQNTGTTSTQQEAILDNEQAEEEESIGGNDNTGTTNNKGVNFGKNFRVGSASSGRSVTNQSKLGNLVTPKGETPTLEVNEGEKENINTRENQTTSSAREAAAPEIAAAKPVAEEAAKTKEANPAAPASIVEAPISAAQPADENIAENIKDKKREVEKELNASGLDAVKLSDLKVRLDEAKSISDVKGIQEEIKKAEDAAIEKSSTEISQETEKAKEAGEKVNDLLKTKKETEKQNAEETKQKLKESLEKGTQKRAVEDAQKRASEQAVKPAAPVESEAKKGASETVTEDELVKLSHPIEFESDDNKYEIVAYKVLPQDGVCVILKGSGKLNHSNLIEAVKGHKEFEKYNDIRFLFDYELTNTRSLNNQLLPRKAASQLETVPESDEQASQPAAAPEIAAAKPAAPISTAPEPAPAAQPVVEETGAGGAAAERRVAAPENAEEAQKRAPEVTAAKEEAAPAARPEAAAAKVNEEKAAEEVEVANEKTKCFQKLKLMHNGEERIRLQEALYDEKSIENVKNISEEIDKELEKQIADATTEGMKVEYTNKGSWGSNYDIEVTLPEGKTSVKLDYDMLEKLAKLTPKGWFTRHATPSTISSIVFKGSMGNLIGRDKIDKKQIADFYVDETGKCIRRFYLEASSLTGNYGEHMAITVDASKAPKPRENEYYLFTKTDLETYAKECGVVLDSIAQDGFIVKGLEKGDYKINLKNTEDVGGLYNKLGSTDPDDEDEALSLVNEMGGQQQKPLVVEEDDEKVDEEVPAEATHSWQKIDKPIEFKSNGKQFKITEFRVGKADKAGKPLEATLKIEGPKGAEIDEIDIDEALGSEFLQTIDKRNFQLENGIKISGYESLTFEEQAVRYKIEKNTLYIRELKEDGDLTKFVESAVNEWNKVREENVTAEDITRIQVNSLDGEFKYYLRMENKDGTNSFKEINEVAKAIAENIEKVDYDGWWQAGQWWKLHVTMNEGHKEQVKINEAFLKALDMKLGARLDFSKLASIEIVNGTAQKAAGFDYGTLSKDNKTITFSSDEMKALGEKAFILKAVSEGGISWKKLIGGLAVIGATGYLGSVVARAMAMSGPQNALVAINGQTLSNATNFGQISSNITRFGQDDSAVSNGFLQDAQNIIRSDMDFAGKKGTALYNQASDTLRYVMSPEGRQEIANYFIQLFGEGSQINSNVFKASDGRLIINIPHEMLAKKTDTSALKLIATESFEGFDDAINRKNGNETYKIFDELQNALGNSKFILRNYLMPTSVLPNISGDVNGTNKESTFEWMLNQFDEARSKQRYENYVEDTAGGHPVQSYADYCVESYKAEMELMDGLKKACEKNGIKVEGMEQILEELQSRADSLKNISAEEAASLASINSIDPITGLTIGSGSVTNSTPELLEIQRQRGANATNSTPAGYFDAGNETLKEGGFTPAPAKGGWSLWKPSTWPIFKGSGAPKEVVPTIGAKATDSTPAARVTTSGEESPELRDSIDPETGLTKKSVSVTNSTPVILKSTGGEATRTSAVTDQNGGNRSIESLTPEELLEIQRQRAANPTTAKATDSTPAPTQSSEKKKTSEKLQEIPVEQASLSLNGKISFNTASKKAMAEYLKGLKYEKFCGMFSRIRTKDENSYESVFIMGNGAVFNLNTFGRTAYGFDVGDKEQEKDFEKWKEEEAKRLGEPNSEAVINFANFESFKALENAFSNFPETLKNLHRAEEELVKEMNRVARAKEVDNANDILTRTSATKEQIDDAAEVLLATRPENIPNGMTKDEFRKNIEERTSEAYEKNNIASSTDHAKWELKHALEELETKSLSLVEYCRYLNVVRESEGKPPVKEKDVEAEYVNKMKPVSRRLNIDEGTDIEKLKRLFNELDEKKLIENLLEITKRHRIFTISAEDFKGAMPTWKKEVQEALSNDSVESLPAGPFNVILDKVIEAQTEKVLEKQRETPDYKFAAKKGVFFGRLNGREVTAVKRDVMDLARRFLVQDSTHGRFLLREYYSNSGDEEGNLSSTGVIETSQGNEGTSKKNNASITLSELSDTDKAELKNFSEKTGIDLPENLVGILIDKTTSSLKEVFKPIEDEVEELDLNYYEIVELNEYIKNNQVEIAAAIVAGNTLVRVIKTWINGRQDDVKKAEEATEKLKQDNIKKVQAKKVKINGWFGNRLFGDDAIKLTNTPVSFVRENAAEIYEKEIEPLLKDGYVPKFIDTGFGNPISFPDFQQMVVRSSRTRLKQYFIGKSDGKLHWMEPRKQEVELRNGKKEDVIVFDTDLVKRGEQGEVLEEVLKRVEDYTYYDSGDNEEFQESFKGLEKLLEPEIKFQVTLKSVQEERQRKKEKRRNKKEQKKQAELQKLKVTGVDVSRDTIELSVADDWNIRFFEENAVSYYEAIEELRNNEFTTIALKNSVRKEIVAEIPLKNFQQMVADSSKNARDYGNRYYIEDGKLKYIEAKKDNILDFNPDGGIKIKNNTVSVLGCSYDMDKGEYKIIYITISGADVEFNQQTLDEIKNTAGNRLGFGAFFKALELGNKSSKDVVFENAVKFFEKPTSEDSDSETEEAEEPVVNQAARNKEDENSFGDLEAAAVAVGIVDGGRGGTSSENGDEEESVSEDSDSETEAVKAAIDAGIKKLEKLQEKKNVDEFKKRLKLSKSIDDLKRLQKEITQSLKSIFDEQKGIFVLTVGYVDEFLKSTEKKTPDNVMVNVNSLIFAAMILRKMEIAITEEGDLLKEYGTLGELELKLKNLAEAENLDFTEYFKGAIEDEYTANKEDIYFLRRGLISVQQQMEFFGKPPRDPKLHKLYTCLINAIKQESVDKIKNILIQGEIIEESSTDEAAAGMEDKELTFSRKKMLNKREAVTLNDEKRQAKDRVKGFRWLSREEKDKYIGSISLAENLEDLATFEKDAEIAEEEAARKAAARKAARKAAEESVNQINQKGFEATLKEYSGTEITISLKRKGTGDSKKQGRRKKGQAQNQTFNPNEIQEIAKAFEAGGVTKITFVADGPRVNCKAPSGKLAEVADYKMEQGTTLMTLTKKEEASKEEAQEPMKIKVINLDETGKKV